MGVFQNAVKRKTHKERDQPQARKRKLGMLEKHEDYKLRAEDYHSKRRRLNALKRKAELRNPDEFYFGMVNQATREGVHLKNTARKQVVSSIEFEESKVPDKVMRIVRTQNLNHLNSLMVQEAAKVEKLKQGLHFVDDARPSQHLVFREEEESLADAGNDDDDDDDEKEGDESDVNSESLSPRSTALDTSSSPVHGAGAVNTDKAYKRLLSSMRKVETLKASIAHLELKRNLMGKGRRIKIKDGEEGKPPVYRWRNERKR